MAVNTYNTVVKVVSRVILTVLNVVNEVVPKVMTRYEVATEVVKISVTFTRGMM